MKFIGILLLFILSAFTTQHSVLPLNKSGKVAFEGTVNVEGLDKEALFRNALLYSENVQKVSDRAAKPQLNFAEGKVRKEGSFLVYKQGMLTQQPHGEIEYTVELNVNDEGFSYTYTDFEFQYYERNRYGVYAPVSGKKKALEEEKFAGMQELWEKHKKTTRRHIDNHIRTLTARMAQVPPGARLEEETEDNAN